MFEEQLIRIKDKLARAKAKDTELNQFGADEHLYEFNPPLSAHEVRQFEQQKGIQLPEDFFAFITTLGNGGPGAYGGPGPFYGVYELGELGYMVGTENTMALPCLITTQLTHEQWLESTAFDEGYSIMEKGTAYYQQYYRLFSGLLPIGTQGDSFQTMLILNGDAYGRVVSIDQDLQMPILAPQKNFLDWYEHWLDVLL